METILFINVIELYFLIALGIILCLISMFWLLALLLDSFTSYKRKRKFKKV